MRYGLSKHLNALVKGHSARVMTDLETSLSSKKFTLDMTR